MKPSKERGAVIVEPRDRELLLASLDETDDLGPGHPHEIISILGRIDNEVLPIEFDPSDSRIILSSLGLAMGNPSFSRGFVGSQEAHETYEAYRKQALEQGLW